MHPITASVLIFLFRIPGFGGSDEAVAAEKILDCFDQGDGEGMKACTSQALFTYLDNEVNIYMLLLRHKLKLRDIT